MCRKIIGHRVDRRIIFIESVAEVRPRCKACLSYISNHLALLNIHSRPDTRCKPAHMEISRPVDAVVLDLHNISITAAIQGFRYNTVTCCQTWGAGGSRVIRPVLRPSRTKGWVHPG